MHACKTTLEKRSNNNPKAYPVFSNSAEATRNLLSIAVKITSLSTNKLKNSISPYGLKKFADILKVYTPFYEKFSDNLVSGMDFFAFTLQEMVQILSAMEFMKEVASQENREEIRTHAFRAYKTWQQDQEFEAFS